MNKKYWIIAGIIVMAVLLSIFSTGRPGSPTREPVNALLFRKIGHELLLSSGDDTSRVMPIQERSPNEFRITFENPLVLLPDSIISIVNKTLANANLPENYSVNVFDCISHQNVYGFMITGSGSSDIVSCRGRSLPTGCYFIDIKFSPDAATSKMPVWLFGGVGALAVLFLVAKFYKQRTRSNSADEERGLNQHALIRIGSYSFNFEEHYLQWENERTVLTNKESKLLSLFAASINKVIDRNVLQKEVWENEGVIVTRSLDMFVSKLRKKLQQDPTVKIINIPGKGYKLEVAEQSGFNV